MKITIVRHAKTEANGTGWITSAALREWISEYNASPLSTTSTPSDELKNVAQDSDGFVCSNLRRSIESARLLGVHKIIHQSDLFAEAGLPYANSDSIKLPANLWAALFRLLWMMGYCSNSESHLQAKSRAKDAAEKLKDLADVHAHVVYIGHGIFNRMVAKELLSDDWQGPKYPSGKYWGHTVYVSPLE